MTHPLGLTPDEVTALHAPRPSPRSGHWLQTFSGARFDLRHPRAADIRTEDICHALACVNRYTGHALRPYSVAEHSVRVAMLVEPRHRKAALLHDATEAYVNDLAAPFKRMPELTGYRDTETAVWHKVCERFDLDLRLPAEVKRADLIAFEVERRILLGEPPEPWALAVSDEDADRAACLWSGEGEPALAWSAVRGGLGWNWAHARDRLRECLSREGTR